MLRLLLLLLGSLWIWETVRYVGEQHLATAFARTRAVHPLVAAAYPVAVLWPDYVTALGVAGATGLLVVVVDRYLSAASPTPVQLPRRRNRGGLPDLP